jgi:hypothetical protein
MPPDWAIATAAGQLEMVPLVFATHSETEPWGIPVRMRGIKAARELKAALQDWIDTGGEVRKVGADGRSSALRPGGVRHGETWERFNELARALDAAMPHIERRLAPTTSRRPATKPRTRMILDLRDVFLNALRNIYPTPTLPGISADGPVVRFIAASVEVLKLPTMERAAIAQALRRHG